MELNGLLQQRKDGKEEEAKLRHVVIPLLGEFKGRKGERWHLLLLADITASGFKLRTWTEQVALMLKMEGKTDRPVMCEEDRTLLLPSKVEGKFHNQLATIQLSHPHLIDPTVDVADLYGISRSPRIGSNSRATDQGVNKEL
eukprot:749616-Ditylum_brightwellii.AAC.1